MPETWEDLKFWHSGEWQVIEEKYDDLARCGTRVNPEFDRMFRCLDLCPLDTVKVAIYGQDPYPNPNHASGIAFSIDQGEERSAGRSPTIENLFLEYSRDLGLPSPSSCDLTPWVSQGVLLWNVIPSCTAWKSLSHDWPEWQVLNKEICEVLSARGVVFALLGSKARAYAQFIKNSPVIETSHPSPRGVMAKRNPFFGSRLFSTINSKLDKPIDWRLP